MNTVTAAGQGYTDSLWWSQLDPASLTARDPLPGDREHDVVIVGAGLTGLWSAYYLLRRDPTLRVAVVEQAVVGAGASGRNGGWCSALLPIEWSDLAERYGREATIAFQRAADDTLLEIERIVAEHSVDCDFVRGGYLKSAGDKVQLERLRHELADARTWGRTEADLRELTAEETKAVINAPSALGGLFNPHCAAVQPAKMTRGLATVVEAMGAVIYEHTAAIELLPGRVRTAHGDLRAEIVVRATEAYSGELPGFRREVLPFYSSMIATEPLPDEMWAQIGWHLRETWNDATRNMFYAQRTADGRIAFGGRGARQRFAATLLDPLPELDDVQRTLQARLLQELPQVGDARITHRWAGVLGITRDWMPSVRFDRATGTVIAGGYGGDGVALTNLAGRTVADLVQGQQTDLLQLPWVGHTSRKWEAEPLRWLGVRAGETLAVLSDKVEARTGKRSRVFGGISRALSGH